jgi:phosphomannomutase
MSVFRKLRCFKAYDVRGKVGEDLNEDIAYRIGRATAQSLKIKTIALGFDARETSPSLAEATAKGICDAGADVVDIGLTGTEEVYFAVTAFNTGAGIEITASHNPINYNGMKIVKQGSQPLTEQEFFNIKKLAEEGNFIQSDRSGLIINEKTSARDAYVNRILDFIDLKSLKPLKIVINSGNGAAGPTIDAIHKKLKEKGVETQFLLVDHDPDASFPNGIPNPMLEENRSATANAVVRGKADFGVAFDGDFDRCFLFDHQGNFISGEYMVGLLSEIFIGKETNATIVHDPRVVWNTIDVIRRCNGHAVASKTGHAFVKATMRKAGAIYGGEMSAHHYFRDFSYCDSGMIPWLMVWQLLSEKKVLLSELIAERKDRFPTSGELNFTVPDATKCLQMMKDLFAAQAGLVDELDGLSMSFNSWRFNLRMSNTEPLVRLNVETKGDELLLIDKTEELTNLIKGFTI